MSYKSSSDLAGVALAIVEVATRTNPDGKASRSQRPGQLEVFLI
jgi:hypothetical protein